MKHNGKIEFESQHKIGSKFKFRFIADKIIGTSNLKVEISPINIIQNQSQEIISPSKVEKYRKRLHRHYEN